MYLNLVLGCAFLFVGLVSLGGIPGDGSAVGGRVVGIGGAASGLQGFWALFNNQAGMAGVQRLIVGSSLENRFLMTETMHTSIGLLVPVNRSAIGFSLQQFGYSRFREIRVGLAYARPFTNKFSFGVQLDYLGYTLAEGIDRAGGITFEGGMQVMLTDDLVLGIHVYNPLGIKVLRAKGEEPALFMNMGVGYKLSDRINIYAEIEKSLDFKASWKAGLEYHSGKFASFRVGYACLPPRTGGFKLSYTSVICFGGGLVFNRLQLDVGGTVNTLLGLSPVVSLAYFLSKPGDEE